MQKLKNWKKALKVWNKQVFSDVQLAIFTAQRNLLNIQREIASQGFSDERFQFELNAHLALEKALENKYSTLKGQCWMSGFVIRIVIQVSSIIWLV